MDNFYEHLYKYHKKPIDVVVQILTFLSTVAISAAAYMVISVVLPKAGFYNTFLGRFLGILAIIGCVYVGYKLFMKFDIEYEYTYMTGVIDFDKILSKSERTRILTAECGTFERFGEYTPEIRKSLLNEEFNRLFDFSSNSGAKRYYAICTHKEHKKIIIIFEPTEEMLTDMKRFMKISFR